MKGKNGYKQHRYRKERPNLPPGVPNQVWRVVPNHRCNEWNDEPEYRVIRYEVFDFDEKQSRYYVESAGWHGKKHRHWIKADGAYTSQQAAKDAMAKMPSL